MDVAQINIKEMSDSLINKIKDIKPDYSITEEGEVVEVKDGVLSLYGLDHIGSNELIELDGGVMAMAMNLESFGVKAVVLGDCSHVKQGDRVRRTGRLVEVPVGKALLGRVVNALGVAVDGRGAIETQETSLVEKIAPGVITRSAVSVPLQTGIKSIDAMVPIGRGQRELIIGDRKTGKTTVAIDAILNQKGKGVYCIYVSIGSKATTLHNIVALLEQEGAMEYTTVVNASASEFASLQYLAPYSGCAMGEYYRDRGMDALVVYDDLSKHAVAYRQLSLLLRRPPGREAFPGDIFYLHSRLLERAACVSASYVEAFTQGKVIGKTGSLTALPIIETQAGDLSAFVPTNVISITDGQIYLDEGLFNSGVRPALDTGLSVSRVGGAAQSGLIKKLSGGIRIALAQYKEKEAFSQFSQDLDEQTKLQLKKGAMMIELLKQPAHETLSVAEMAAVLISTQMGLERVLEVREAFSFSQNLLVYLKSKHQALLDAINDDPVYDEKTVEQIKSAVESYIKQL